MENRKREWKEYSSSVGLNDTGKAVKNQAKTREREEAFNPALSHSGSEHTMASWRLVSTWASYS